MLDTGRCRVLGRTLGRPARAEPGSLRRILLGTCRVPTVTGPAPALAAPRRLREHLGEHGVGIRAEAAAHVADLTRRPVEPRRRTGHRDAVDVDERRARTDVLVGEKV